MRRRMFAAVCLAGALTLLLGGCAGSKALPLGERAVVKLAALSSGPHSYQALLLYLTSNPEAATADGEENTPHLLYGCGASVTDALHDACDQAGKQVFFAQNELLLLDQDLDRTQVLEAIKEFGAERFCGTRAYLYSADAADLPHDAQKMYRLADGLEQLGEKEGRPLYAFSDDTACLLPMYAQEESGMKTAGGLVYPVEGRPFELTGSCWEPYRAIEGEDGFSCLSGPDRCTVTGIQLLSQASEKNGSMVLELTLTGSICDYQGKLEPEEVTQKAEDEIKQVFSRFYSDICLDRQTDLLSFGPRMAQYDKKRWTKQTGAGPVFNKDTVIFLCSLRMAS